MGGTPSKKNLKVKHGRTNNLKTNSITGSREELSSCKWRNSLAICSLRSRRLELVGTRKNARDRKRHARGEGAITPCVSPSRTSVLSFAHYFQASATQAKWFNRWNPPRVWFLVIFPSRIGMERWKNTLFCCLLTVLKRPHYLPVFYLWP